MLHQFKNEKSKMKNHNYHPPEAWIISIEKQLKEGKKSLMLKNWTEGCATVLRENLKGPVKEEPGFFSALFTSF